MHELACVRTPAHVNTHTFTHARIQSHTYNTGAPPRMRRCTKHAHAQCYVLCLSLRLRSPRAYRSCKVSQHGCVIYYYYYYYYFYFYFYLDYYYYYYYYY